MQASHGLDEPVPPQGLEEIRDRPRRVLQVASLFGDGRQDDTRSQIEQVSHELVWVLGLDAEPVELPFGEVVEVRRCRRSLRIA